MSNNIHGFKRYIRGELRTVNSNFRYIGRFMKDQKKFNRSIKIAFDLLDLAMICNAVSCMIQSHTENKHYLALKTKIEKLECEAVYNEEEIRALKKALEAELRKNEAPQD